MIDNLTNDPQFAGGCTCHAKAPTVPVCRDRMTHLDDCPAKGSGYPVGMLTDTTTSRELLAHVAVLNELGAAQHVGEVVRRLSDDVEYCRREWESACERERAAQHLREQAEARAEWAEQSAHTRAKQLEAMSEQLAAIERDRDGYHAKYLATVAAWEGAKAAREKSDILLQQCLDELRKVN